MNLAGDDLEAAYYVARRFVDGMRAAKHAVPEAVRDWCFKVNVLWETSADGRLIDSGGEELEEAPLDTAAVAREIGVGEREVRRLAQKGDIAAHKCGPVWAFSKQAVAEHMEARSGRARPRS